MVQPAAAAAARPTPQFTMTYSLTTWYAGERVDLTAAEIAERAERAGDALAQSLISGGPHRPTAVTHFNMTHTPHTNFVLGERASDRRE